MKLFKKLFAVVLLGIMVLSMVACGNSNDNGTSETKEEGTQNNTSDSNSGQKTQYDKVVYSYATFNNIPSEEILATVEEEINKITRTKIGAEIELMPIAIFDYASKISLSLQSGEKVDIIQSLGDFNLRVSSKMAYDLSDMIDTSAAETKALLGQDLLNACIKDGKLYGIPTYKPYALTPMIIYKQDIADELGIDMLQVKDINDLTDILRQVKAAYPDMTPLVPVNKGDSGIARTIGEIDYLTDDLFSPKGVLQGDSMEVVDYYSLPEFKEVSELARLWYNEGLILKDAATTTSTATELMSADNSFCYIAAYSYPPEDTAASLSAQMGGQPLGAVQIGDAYLDTTSINALSWMVSSTSDVPEAALKFLNMTFTDKDIVNLLIYGIKDRDYVLDGEGYMSYPENQDSTTVPYTAQLSCGTLGNFFIMHPMEGTSFESLAWEEEQNQIARKSPAMGFTFDPSNVKTEYSAVNNVISQYLPVLVCGSVDPESVLPEFIDELKSAGLDSIIEEKQTQLNAWSAN